jgi:hypothetical protein
MEVMAWALRGGVPGFLDDTRVELGAGFVIAAKAGAPALWRLRVNDGRVVAARVNVGGDELDHEMGAEFDAMIGAGAHCVQAFSHCSHPSNQ